MAILITKESKIIIQGFTGKIGTFHAEEMMEYGWRGNSREGWTKTFRPPSF